MKVLIVIKSMIIGGSEKLIKDICKFYDKDKIDLYVATITNGLWDEEIDNNIVKHFYFERIKEKYTFFDRVKKYFVNIPLYKTLEEEFDVCIVFREGMFDFMEYVKAKKYILWIHEDYAYWGKNKNTKNIGGWRYLLLTNLKKRYLKKYDALVACTENARESYELYYKIKDVKVVTNSINEIDVQNKCNEDINLPIEFKDNYIVNVNRLEVEKRVELLVDLFYECLKKDKNLKLVIIGDGNNRKFVEEKIDKYNISENCLLFGETTNPFPYVKHAKMLVSTAWHESFGLAVAEAMCLGVPAVCLWNRGIDAFIKNGISGVTVNSNEEFIDEVIKVSNNEEYRQMLSKNAKESIREFADIVGYVRKVEDFIFKVYNQEL